MHRVSRDFVRSSSAPVVNNHRVMHPSTRDGWEECQGSYFHRATGAPAIARVFSCDDQPDSAFSEINRIGRDEFQVALPRNNEIRSRVKKHFESSDGKEFDIVKIYISTKIDGLYVNKFWGNGVLFSIDTSNSLPLWYKVYDYNKGVFKVDAILSERRGVQGTEYLVKWCGYGKSHDSWEPEDNICDKDIIKRYISDKQNMEDSDPDWDDLEKQDSDPDWDDLSADSEHESVIGDTESESDSIAGNKDDANSEAVGGGGGLVADAHSEVVDTWDGLLAENEREREELYTLKNMLKRERSRHIQREAEYASKLKKLRIQLSKERKVHIAHTQMIRNISTELTFTDSVIAKI